jgi:Rogdi leucine zipper containing protein
MVRSLHLVRLDTDKCKDIQLRLQTLPPPNRAASWPLKLAAGGEEGTGPSLMLDQLAKVRNLINQSLDVVDISTWTGDALDANFIAGQLRLLHDLLQEARQVLKGSEEMRGAWWDSPLDEQVRRSSHGIHAVLKLYDPLRLDLV